MSLSAHSSSDMTIDHTFKIIRLDARTLSWWRSRKEKIDVDPSYQRKGRRWAVSDKQYLVDSIINGFDVPKFYVADFTWGNSALNEKKKEYAVIDGKQRFEAIFDFFDNVFPLANDFVFIRDPGISASGMYYSELKALYPDLGDVFDNFNPDVMAVVTNNKVFVEELFVRLNRSKPLSGAEIRNAISGPLTEVVRKIRDHEFFRSNVRFSTSKGQDLNCATKLLMFEMSGIQETKKVNMDKFVRQTKDDQKVGEIATRAMATLDELAERFQFKDSLLTSEGQIPVYYWLYRNLNDSSKDGFRDFIGLVQGDLKGDSSGVLSKKEVVEFKAASRSINDKSSHEVRFAILSRSFDRWVQEGASVAPRKKRRVS